MFHIFVVGISQENTFQSYVLKISWKIIIGNFYFSIHFIAFIIIYYSVRIYVYVCMCVCVWCTRARARAIDEVFKY